MKRSVRLAAIALFLHANISAQSLNTAKLDSFFDQLASRNLAMGSIAISKNGVVQYQKAIGYGYIDSSKKIAANIGTKYRIGSESKMFTAVMIFQLIEEHKITLDQKLAEYFPSLPNANKITISNLLNHRSGLHNYSEGTNFPDWMDKPMTHAELLKIITDKGPDFEPNAKADYSNSNYLLLSYIIEKVCKTSYDSALTKRVISKIRLKNTLYGHPINVKQNEAASYKNAGGKWNKEKETNMIIHSGAGSIVSTPTDMVRFIEALFTYKLIGKTSLQTMTNMVDDYGRGIFPMDHGSKIAYGHNGRVEEFYSSDRYFPGEKLAVAYITNGIIYPRADIIEGVLKICFNEPFVIPFSTSITLKPADLDKYTGQYSCSQPPINVSCTNDSTRLLLETKGTILDVTPIGDNYFMHKPSGTFFEFRPEKDELLIKETDSVYYLTRKK